MNKEKINKATIIKEYLQNEKNAKKPALTISMALTQKHGVDITPRYVDVMKWRLRAKKKTQETPRKVEKSLTIDDLIAAKEFVNKCGSIENAKKTMDALTILSQ